MYTGKLTVPNMVSVYYKRMGSYMYDSEKHLNKLQPDNALVYVEGTTGHLSGGTKIIPNQHTTPAQQTLSTNNTKQIQASLKGISLNQKY